jgi:hypothetical protein
VKNVFAAGGAQLETLGTRYDLADPVVVHDPSRKKFPPVVRTILWIIGAADFMQLSIDGRKIDRKKNGQKEGFIRDG